MPREKRSPGLPRPAMCCPVSPFLWHFFFFLVENKLFFVREQQHENEKKKRSKIITILNSLLKEGVLEEGWKEGEIGSREKLRKRGGFQASLFRSQLKTNLESNERGGEFEEGR